MGRSRPSSPAVPSRTPPKEGGTYGIKTPTREGPSSIKDGRVFRGGPLGVFRGGPRSSGSSSEEGIRKAITGTPVRRRRKKKDRKKDGDRPTFGPRSPGFSCPDPSMDILLADGSLKKAGDLKVGDKVKTYHEKDLEKEGKLARHESLVLSSGGVEKHSQLIEQLENSYTKASLGEYKVEYVNIVRDVEKIKLTFEGSEIICSLTHKFYVNDSWKEARDMVIGDKVSDKKLTTIEKVEDGDVVHITVKDAHTYICEGLLSHNKRFLNPPKDPTLGGPPEREIPMPRERRPIITRESEPRGPAPFAPPDSAKERFFETLFERSRNKKEMRDIEVGERRDRQEAMREEARMRDSERGGGRRMRDDDRGGRRKKEDRGGKRMRDDDRGGRNRRKRRDFTRKRSRMEGRRSREERGAFRDRYVSTLRR